MHSPIKTELKVIGERVKNELNMFILKIVHALVRDAWPGKCGASRFLSCTLSNYMCLILTNILGPSHTNMSLKTSSIAVNIPIILIMLTKYELPVILFGSLHIFFFFSFLPGKCLKQFLI